MKTWATLTGRDGYGEWAEAMVEGVVWRFRQIAAGRFQMGSPEGEEDRYDDEGPQHEVTLTRDFWLGDTPVTQGLWRAVMGTNPSRFRGPDRPVERVSWDDCKVFLARLNALSPDLDARLPTEAEWEYACRGGTTEPRYGELDEVAWYDGNSGGETHFVGKKLPNAWGLYDMLGNVGEWCADWHALYGAAHATAPRGPDTGRNRVNRGGSWHSLARHVRAAHRLAFVPGYRHGDLGFRLARGQESGPEGAEPLPRSGAECRRREPDGWARIKRIKCDLCEKYAVWSHPAGGQRCAKCPRPVAGGG